MSAPILDILSSSPYQGYAYAYPHKTAYRPLSPPVPLREAWAAEPRDSVFLYWHVPFCEMRCGFCNLFTTALPRQTMVSEYMAALTRQAEVVREEIGDVTVTRMAIGGGTPTWLDVADLEALFDLSCRLFGAAARSVPTSVETSPGTAGLEKVSVLRERGVSRISIGVQSFLPEESRAAGRQQDRAEVERALDRIRQAGFPVLNIDLIYGLPGQTVQSWEESLRAALRFSPEELYLYPLYVRPVTGLSRTRREWDDIRRACYRAGRELLLSEGYQQLSMRSFRKGQTQARDPAPDYCCQGDGMIGLGCGARSYTRELHYASDYAVGRAGVRAILGDYAARSRESFTAADFGVRLDEDEQRRRYVIKSILRVDGLDGEGYKARFGADVSTDLPALDELLEAGLACTDGARLCLTAAGLELSDAIGPWFYSDAVRNRMEEYELR